MAAERNRFIRTLAFLLSLALVPAAARADWPSEGKQIIYEQPPSYESVEAITAPNGDLIVTTRWGPSDYYIHAQRISPDGEIVWNQGSISFHTSAFNNWYRSAIVHTDDGGLLHVGYARSLYVSVTRDVILQRFYPDGTHPAYPPPVYYYGWQLEHTVSPYEASVDAASDGSSGVYATWCTKGRIRLQRRLVDGTVAAPWPATGMLVATTTISAADPGATVKPDGSGGAVLLWVDDAGAHVDRILADTTRAPGWPAGGIMLGPGAKLIGYQQLIPSGPSHFIATWFLPGPISGQVRLLAQRFDLNGSVDPAWSVGGLELVAATSNYSSGLNVQSDGVGGVHVVWPQDGVPRWSRWKSDGTLAPGHTKAGRSLLDANAQFSQPWDNPPKLMAVGQPNGGLVFVWSDLRLGGTGRAMWFLGDGTNDPAEPDTGRVLPRRVLAFRTPSARVLDVAHFRRDQSGYGVALTRILPPELVDAPRPAPPAAGLQLSVVGAQPARGTITLSYSLPTDAPAELALYDLSGRRLRSFRVQGAGTHALALAELTTGLYLASLASEGERRTARVVVVR